MRECRLGFGDVGGLLMYDRLLGTAEFYFQYSRYKHHESRDPQLGGLKLTSEGHSGRSCLVRWVVCRKMIRLSKWRRTDRKQNSFKPCARSEGLRFVFFLPLVSAFFFKVSASVGFEHWSLAFLGVK